MEITLKQISEITGIRVEVLEFALIMEEKLKENDYKGGWKDCETGNLLSMACDEIKEVAPAVSTMNKSTTNKNINDVQKECADVANFMMMISDNLQRKIYNYNK